MSPIAVRQFPIHHSSHAAKHTENILAPLMHDLPHLVNEPISATVLPLQKASHPDFAHEPYQAWRKNVQPKVPAFHNAQKLCHLERAGASGSFAPRASPQEACHVVWSRRIVQNTVFVACTTLLTVWALAGDDVRIMCTNKPADPIFDVVVIVCMLVFTFEIVVSCFGSDDYFMGFFFGLDIISTCTLILDLTQTRNAMSGDGTDYDRARSSKTARIGAKLGRMARVLRIVRIVKLFKAFHSNKASRLKKTPTVLDFEEDEEDVFDLRMSNAETESLVSKKLSTRMTQRTIVLVLVLLVVLPQLGPEESLLMGTSASLGADDLHQAFQQVLQGSGSRSAYEELFLQYVYFHNWFLGHGGQTCPPEVPCASWYFGQAFWFGFAGKNHRLVRMYAENGNMHQQTVHAWEERSHGHKDYRYFFGSLPFKARQMLWLPWTTECLENNRLYRGFSLLSQRIEATVTYPVSCPDDLRKTEIVQFTPQFQTVSQQDNAGFLFFFDLRPFTHREARLSLLTTVFVCIVLCVASTMFAHDANVLVLQPLEQMMSKVVAIRNDPLAAIQLADDEFRREETRRRKIVRTNKSRFVELLSWILPNRIGQAETMETVILEKTIIKLGTLLALGFGQAGANIVKQNMIGANTSGVNAMIEGSRVNCIIGSTRILNFDIATEVLQGEVMKFVNQIAEIVHGVVDECNGAINRNNGNGFLVVWRGEGIDNDGVEKMANLSVYAFARILAAVHRSPVLAEYRMNPLLKARLFSKCRVNMSFGLHYGWAIEGAVGSEFKIDASYLSPNVSLAVSIEAATRIYGVNILASEAVVNSCSVELAEQLRLIDKVVINGSKHPLRLYCLDLDYLKLRVGAQALFDDDFVWDSVERYKARKIHKSMKRSLWDEQSSIARFLVDHDDFVDMRQDYTLEFLQLFNMGYQNYAEGEWLAAKQYMTKTLRCLGVEDGPSAALMQFMGRNQFWAPPDWHGVHDIREELDTLTGICH